LKAPPARKLSIDGPAGSLEIAINESVEEPRGLALLAHPHPLYGGTLDNKVVQTLAKAFVALGYCALRLNFRGVGSSSGVFDEGRGEVDDFLALADYGRRTYGERELAIGGFSFGAFIAASVVQAVAPLKEVFDWARPQALPVIVFPGAGHFFHGSLVQLQRVVERHCRAE
jgi:alpha/beta superfamily hydrolase